MANKNLKFIDTLINTEKKDGIDSIKRYTHGECDNLVHYLKMLNNNKGERIRILYNEDEDYYNPTLHFVFKMNNIYYDINGAFTSIEALIEKCPLFDIKLFEELDIYSEEANPEWLDIEFDSKEYKDILNIIKKMNKSTTKSPQQ